jgi:hypothetical protein
LCRYLDSDNSPVRGPFLGLVGTGWVKHRADQVNGAQILPDVHKLYAGIQDLTFDEIIGFFGALDSWSVTKRRPPKQQEKQEARLERFDHTDAEQHLGLQFLLSGILSVYYDETRHGRKRPAFTAFESGRAYNEQVRVPFSQLR